FGLARDQRGDRALTLSGEIIGTPDYLAPEQIRDSRNVDHRADLYALGCTAYFLLTGQAPFANLALFEKLFAHGEKDPVPVEQVRREIPKALGDVARKLMAKRPVDRYQSGAEVAEALAAFVPVTDTDRREEAAPSPPVGPAFPARPAVVGAPGRDNEPANEGRESVPPPAAPPAQAVQPRAPPASAPPLLPETTPRRRRSLVAAVVLGVLAATAFAAARNHLAREEAKQDAAGDGELDPEGRRTHPRVLFLLASWRPALDEY